MAFGTVAVKADVEGLRELKVPLWERTGVEGVKEGKGGGVRVFVGANLIVVLLVREE